MVDCACAADRCSSACSAASELSAAAEKASGRFLYLICSKIGLVSPPLRIERPSLLPGLPVARRSAPFSKRVVLLALAGSLLVVLPGLAGLETIELPQPPTLRALPPSQEPAPLIRPAPAAPNYALPQHSSTQNQTVDLKYQEQEKDRIQTIQFCWTQYRRADYFSLQANNKSSSNSLFSGGNGIDGYRFIATANGIQGVNGSAIQQSSGKWKCDRGIIERPMTIGKEYVESRPIYQWPSGCSPLASPYSLIPLAHLSGSGCSAAPKVIGRRTKSSMLKEEIYDLSGRVFLVLYDKDEAGKVSRRVLGISFASMQRLFPYSEQMIRVEDSALVREVRLGPAALNCSAGPTFLKSNGYDNLKSLFLNCLERKGR
jgi:hypothetical protein